MEKPLGWVSIYFRTDHITMESSTKGNLMAMVSFILETKE